MVEAGLAQREHIKWKPMKPVCSADSFMGAGAVTIFEVTPLFALMFTGITVSFIILLVEVHTFRLTRKHNNAQVDTMYEYKNRWHLIRNVIYMMNLKSMHKK